MVVVVVTGVAWFAGDEEPWRRCVGRWLFRSTPATKEGEKVGEGVRGSLRHQIERKERRGRLLPRKNRSPKVAALGSIPSTERGRGAGALLVIARRRESSKDGENVVRGSLK